MMNELQKKELELLQFFIAVCEQLHLKYYLVCGSALGAVKYGGFIPWDDDIDVAMPRKDYDIFCREGQKLLPQNIFIQTFRTDPNFPKIFCKLRNSDTTYIETPYQKLKMNHGIFIDIFALDEHPEIKRKQQYFHFVQRMYLRVLSSALELPRSKKAALLVSFFRCFGFHKHTHKILVKYEKFIKRNSLPGSSIWCNYGNFRGSLELTPKSVYADGGMAVFEGIAVRIPKQYDIYLTQKYGDWRADLPKDEQKGHHFYSACDINTPYTYFLERTSRGIPD